MNEAKNALYEFSLLHKTWKRIIPMTEQNNWPTPCSGCAAVIIDQFIVVDDNSIAFSAWT